MPNGAPVDAPEIGSKYIPEFPVRSAENVPIHFFFITTYRRRPRIVTRRMNAPFPSDRSFAAAFALVPNAP